MKSFMLKIKNFFCRLPRPFAFVPALCVLYIIFIFSAQNGDDSAVVSRSVGELLVTAVNDILRLHLSPSQILYHSESLQTLIRKTAHITEYFLLALSIAFPLHVYRMRRVLLLIVMYISTVVFAGLDELHQFFVSDRLASLTDVGIDSIGALLAVLVLLLCSYLRRRSSRASSALQAASGQTSLTQK